MKFFSILFKGSPPPSTYIRAMPIFKLPEHAKDIVRCCPNHTLLDQTTSRGKATNTRCSIARNVLGNRCFLISYIYIYFQVTQRQDILFVQTIHKQNTSSAFILDVSLSGFPSKSMVSTFICPKTMPFNCT